MKPFKSMFSVSLDGKVVMDAEPNTFYELEVERHFFEFVTANAPDTYRFSADQWFQHSHRPRSLKGRNGFLNHQAEYTARVNMSVESQFRYRLAATDTSLAPSAPNQIAFPIGRLSTGWLFTPEGCMSTRDASALASAQIGTVFAHPEGRAAYFNETAVVANGSGQVINGGAFNPPPGGDMHYIFDLRVVDGDAGPGFASGSYVWRRHAWLKGCYETHPNGLNDFVGTSNTMEQIMQFGGRHSVDGIHLTPQTPSPVPANIPMNVEYPTAAAQSQVLYGVSPGQAYDGLADGRIWWVHGEFLTGSDTDNVRSRALWAWFRMTGQEFVRCDQPGGNQPALGDEESTVLTDFPAIGDTVRFNDIKFARNGWGFIACDAQDDDDVGSDAGALIMFDAKRVSSTVGNKTITAASGAFNDPNAAFPTYIEGRKILILDAANPGNVGLFNVDTRTDGQNLILNGGTMDTDETTDLRWILVEGIQEVVGASVSGFYTVGGALENNVTAITIDKTENHVAANIDRIWFACRDGLNFVDLDTVAGTLSAVSTVTEGGGGGTFTTLTANSERALSRYIPAGAGSLIGQHNPMLDHDNAGDVYWISALAGASGVRLNKVTGVVGHVHTFYSITSGAAEGGALGAIDLGSTGQDPTCLIIHRRDPGDPADDDVWMTGTANSTSATSVAQISITDFDAGGNDPQINGVNGSTNFPGAQLIGASDTQAYPANLHVAVDGSVYWINGDNPRVALLYSMTRQSIAGLNASVATGDQIQANTPIGGQATVTQAGATFEPSMAGKPFRIANAANAANDGDFTIISSPNASDVVIDNAAAVNEGPAATFDWSLPGTGFENDLGGWIGNLFDPDYRHTLGNAFADESGMAFFAPSQINSGAGHIANAIINFFLPVGYQWDSGGMQWYRSRFPALVVAATRPMHGTDEELDFGVTVRMNDPGGSPVFEADEYYTFYVTPGIAKDAVQEITYDASVYGQQALKQTDDNRNQRLCQFHVCRAGHLTGSLAAVATDDPVGAGAQSDTAKRQFAFDQARLYMDGSNGTADLNPNQAVGTSDGVQIGLDLGSDIQASTLNFVMADADVLLWGQMQFDVYSATDAQGNDPSGPGLGSTTWALRASYRADQDHPEWAIDANWNRDLIGVTGIIGSIISGTHYEINLDDLETNGALANPATNDLMRHWKVVVTAYTGANRTWNEEIGPIWAIDDMGLQAAHPADGILSFANTINYLANLMLRVVFLIDESAGSTATSGDGITVTLSADKFDLPLSFTLDQVLIDTPIPGQTTFRQTGSTFTADMTSYQVPYVKTTAMSNAANNGVFQIVGFTDADNLIVDQENKLTLAVPVNEGPAAGGSGDIDGISVGDFYRRLNGSNEIVAEGLIDTVTSDVSIDVDIDDILGTFAGEAWEVVRNADIRPRDGATQARFTEAGAAGEMFICPIRGTIYPHEEDVAAQRLFMIDEAVKIQRGR